MLSRDSRYSNRVADGFNTIHRIMDRDCLFRDLISVVQKYDNRLPTYDKCFVVGIVKKKIRECDSK